MEARRKAHVKGHGIRAKEKVKIAGIPWRYLPL